MYFRGLLSQQGLCAAFLLVTENKKADVSAHMYARTHNKRAVPYFRGFFPNWFFAGSLSLISSEGSVKLRWAGRGTRIAPFCMLKQSKKTGVRSARAHFSTKTASNQPTHPTKSELYPAGTLPPEAVQ